MIALGYQKTQNSEEIQRSFLVPYRQFNNEHPFVCKYYQIINNGRFNKPSFKQDLPFLVFIM